MKNIFKKAMVSSRENALNIITNKIIDEEKCVVVTANSEIVIDTSSVIKQGLLSDETTIVIDGIAIKKVGGILGFSDLLLYPGVELVSDLLEFLNENHLKIAFLGGTKTSYANFKERLESEYSEIQIIMSSHGYISENEKDKFMIDSAKLQPDLVLIGLGVPTQEKLIFKHIEKFNKGVLVGCGGTMDVLGGTKSRAPKLFRKAKLEWLYRIVGEPKRIPRFIKTNITVCKQLLKERKV